MAWYSTYSTDGYIHVTEWYDLYVQAEKGLVIAFTIISTRSFNYLV